MIQPTIETQACKKCGVVNEGSTKIICDECYPNLTRYEIYQKYDRAFQIAVIELFGNECVDCGHSAESMSGELCADHLQQKLSQPLSRYDLASAVCRCMTCHTKRHAGAIERVPPKEKMPKQTQEKQAKHKKPPVCAAVGCPIWAMGTGKKAKFCWKHQ